MFDPVLNLSTLNGGNGFVINGADFSGASGYAVSNVGDVNNDGIEDLIIGAISTSPNGNINAGKSYVVFGGTAVGSSGSLNLSALDGSNGFVISGINAQDYLGSSVSSAGDINNDGIDDLVIGASGADPAGKSYVVFGGVTVGSSGSLNLSALDGSNGFVINDSEEPEESGSSVSSAGDINGDGIDDLIIGAPNAGPDGNPQAGKSYVVFGGVTVGSSGNLNLSALDGSNGFVINGIDAVDYSGLSVSSAGDVNNDGINDLIIGAPYADSNDNSQAGESYVVFGGTTVGSSGSLNLFALDGSNGFVINGINAFDYSGYSVSSAGDVNGDGTDDLIIGAPYASPNGSISAGESYVVFGGATVGSSGNLNLSALDGSNGFVINSIDEGDYSGYSVSNVGDINNDGIDDLIVGAYLASPNGKSAAGESYVVFGGTTVGSSGNLNLSALDGSNGFVINGIEASDFSGYSVSGAGDINNDGIDDLVIGASGADPNGNGDAGASYVVFGKANNVAPTNLALSPTSVAENTALGKVIGNFTTTDPDTDNTFAYTLVNTASFPDNAAFTIDGNQLKVNSAFDFEADNRYTIKVRTTDQGGLSYKEALTIRITNVNEAPDAAGDSRLKANQSTPLKIPVTALLANDTDPDANTVLRVATVGSAAGGSIALSNQGTPANSSDDVVTFSPNSSFSGTASFTYTLSDGKLTDTATVTLEVGKNVNGSTCNDVLNGTAGNDALNGRNGADTLSSGVGNDILNGGNRADTLSGEAGNDILNGGNGADLLTGGRGPDRFVLAKNVRSDTISDFSDGTDTIELLDGLTFEQLTISTNGSSTLLKFGTTLLATLNEVDSTQISTADFVAV